MSRYIDIDDISLRKTIACGGLSAKALWRRIQQAPSIDIVRCKECKHWICNPNTEKWGKCKWISDKQFDVVMNADDYCSYGERREDERLNKEV